jgi:hypothetical protein
VGLLSNRPVRPAVRPWAGCSAERRGYVEALVGRVVAIRGILQFIAGRHIVAGDVK